MGILPKEDKAFEVLEIEYSKEEVAERVKGFLVKFAPPLIFNPSYWKALRVNNLQLVSGDPRLRGLATHRYGSTSTIRLTIEHSTRWMQQSGRSQINQKDDISPSGVLVHELGHHFEWSIENLGFAKIPAYEPWLSIPASSCWCQYGKTSKEEDFAETYRLWVTNIALLKTLDAERSGLMTDMVVQFKKATGFSHKDANSTGKSMSPIHRRVVLEKFLARDDLLSSLLSRINSQ